MTRQEFRDRLIYVLDEALNEMTPGEHFLVSFVRVYLREMINQPNAPDQARLQPSPEAGCSVPAAISEAVAAIYFDDSADYRRALLNVVRHLDAAAYDMTLIDTREAYRRYCTPNDKAQLRSEAT